MVKDRERFKTARLEAAREFFDCELRLKHINIVETFLKDNVETETLWVTIETLDMARSIFIRAAKVKKEELRVIQHYPGNIWARKNRYVAKIKELNERRTKFQFQLRLGFTDVEVWQKERNTSNYFTFVDSAEIFTAEELKNLPPIQFERKEFEQPPGRPTLPPRKESAEERNKRGNTTPKEKANENIKKQKDSDHQTANDSVSDSPSVATKLTNALTFAFKSPTSQKANSRT